MFELSGTVLCNTSRIWEVTDNGGVYFFHDLRGVLYVGKSVSIHRRFMEHLTREQNLELYTALRNPVGTLLFSWIETDNYDQFEREFILQFNPRCNLIKYKSFKKKNLAPAATGNKVS